MNGILFMQRTGKHVFMKGLDEIRYGFSLYPFAVVLALGVFISGTGPTIFQSVTAGLRGTMFYQGILIAGILSIQILGAVVAAAGFFGGLYRVIRDAEE